MFLQKKFDNSAWGKLYSKKLYPYIHYPEGKLYEDLPVTYKLIDKSEKIAYIDTKDYYYVQRTESIQNSSFNEKKLDILPFIEEMQNFIYKKYPSLKKYVDLRSFNAYVNIFKQIPRNNYKKIYIWNLLMSYQFIPYKVLESKFKSKFIGLLFCLGYPVGASLLSPKENIDE